MPFLKEKLAQAQDDLTIRDIIRVFSEMSRQRSYDVSKDVDLIRHMRAAAARMKNHDWKGDLVSVTAIPAPRSVPQVYESEVACPVGDVVEIQVRS